MNFLNFLNFFLFLPGDHKKKDSTFFLPLPQITTTLTNSDITGLFFNTCRLLKVPSKFISSNFSHLKALSIKSSKLREISRNDLKPLVNLEVLSLNGNDLKYLPADLFIDFKHLKSLSFANNKIQLVGLEIFDHLNGLNFVDLRGNENFDVLMNVQDENQNLAVVKNLSELREIFEARMFATSTEDSKWKQKIEELKRNFEAIEREKIDIEKRCLELTESYESLIESQQISLISLEEAEMKLKNQKKLIDEMKDSKKRLKVDEDVPMDQGPSTHPLTSQQSFSNSSLSLQFFNKLNSQEIDANLCKKFIENSSIFNEILQILTSNDFKDFTIRIADENFKVHKFILAARSPVLAEMMKENFSAESLSLENIPVEIFKELLKFFYGGKVEINERNAKEIFMAAGRLKMKELQDISSKILVNLVSESNAVEMLKLSNKYNHEELREKSFEEIQKFFNDKPLKSELAYDYEKVFKLIEAKKKIDEMMKSLEDEMES